MLEAVPLRTRGDDFFYSYLPLQVKGIITPRSLELLEYSRQTFMPNPSLWRWAISLFLERLTASGAG